MYTHRSNVWQEYLQNIMTVGDKRWNYTQGCFASLMRMRGACLVFLIQHQNAPNFPMACIPLCENSFWTTLKNTELLIRPFCDASFLMQRNANTMSHVILVLLHLVKHIQESCAISSSPEFYCSTLRNVGKGRRMHYFPLPLTYILRSIKVRWPSCLRR